MERGVENELCAPLPPAKLLELNAKAGEGCGRARDAASPPGRHSWPRRGRGGKYFMYFHFLIDGFDVLSHFLFYFPTSEVLESAILFPTKSSRFPFCGFSSKPLGQRRYHRGRFPGRRCLPRPPGIAEARAADLAQGSRDPGPPRGQFRGGRDPGQPRGQFRGKSEAGNANAPAPRPPGGGLPFLTGSQPFCSIEAFD